MIRASVLASAAIVAMANGVTGFARGDHPHALQAQQPRDLRPGEARPASERELQLKTATAADPTARAV